MFKIKNMKKVYCVFQPSGSYEDYMYTLKGVCSTREKAENLKNELDKMVVEPNNIYTIIPENIYEKWPFVCDDEENDIWSPESCYEGYTVTEYMEQLVRLENYSKEIYYSEIEEYDLL